MGRVKVADSHMCSFARLRSVGHRRPQQVALLDDDANLGHSRADAASSAAQMTEWLQRDTQRKEQCAASGKLTGDAMTVVCGWV